MRALLSILVVTGAAAAFACDCIRRTDEEALEQVAVVVEGDVAHGEKGRGVITVVKALKGAKVGDTVEFEWPTSSKRRPCPTVPLKPGKWRLYLGRGDIGLVLGICDFNSRSLQ